MKNTKQVMQYNLGDNLTLPPKLSLLFARCLVAIFILASQNIAAQSIVRSTFCATGPTWSNGAGTLTTTFGQCPGCSTLESNNNFITQGFQQPNSNDCFTAGIDFLETTDNCGTVYDFTYTGNANVDEVTFNWNFGPNGFPQTSNLPNPQGVSFTSTGIVFLSLQVIDSSCTRESIISIDVPATGFSAFAIPVSVTCNNGNNGSIEINTTGGSAPLDYTWSTGQQSANIDNLSAGEYTYTVTDADGCQATNVVTITEPEAIMAEAFVQNETCKGDLDGSIEVIISGGTTPYNFQWNNAAATLSQDGLTSGDYALTVTDANDCVNEFTWPLGLSCDLLVNDVISPDGDGTNETWIINGIEQFPNNEVSIFNRWGQRVWQATAYSNDWNGTNEDGEPLPIGAYFYVLKLNDPDDQIISGSVTLVR